MRILVTTDGSARSLRVLPHAAHLARALEADVVLLRLVERDPGPGASVEALHQALDAAESPGDVLIEEPAIGEGVPVAIRRLASALGADLIAMDSRGAGMLRHAVVGSVAMGVIGGGGIPVLVTGDRAGAPVEGPYRLVITDDGSEAAGEILEKVDPLIVGGRLESALLRVYVPRLGDAGVAAELRSVHLQLAERRLRLPQDSEVPLLAEPIRELESIEAAIIRLAQQHGATAIGMSTHGHSAARHVFMGSVALCVLKSSPLPLILGRCG